MGPVNFRQLTQFSIHPEGYIYGLISLLLTLLLWSIWTVFGLIGLAVTIWIFCFFRNPSRVIPQTPGVVVAPADGVVCQIQDKISAPHELGLSGKDWTKVSIFMDIFDVHINRIPMDGEATAKVHTPGRFLTADEDNASEENERLVMLIEDKKTKIQLPCVQIAGLLARRIRCDVQEGQVVERGQTYGLIRFGSRVDVYLPKGIAPHVALGQRTIGGETVLANVLDSDQKALEGKRI